MGKGDEKQYREIEIEPHERESVPIIGAGISPLDAESRDSYFVSLLVDLSTRQDLLGLIEAHRRSEGECSTAWFTAPDDESVFNLLLSFTSPARAKAILSFDILRHGAIVDCLINGQGKIRLVPGTKGEDIGKAFTESRPSVAIPVGATVDPDRWESLWKETIAKTLGISNEEAEKLIMLWRSERRLRLINPDIPPLNQLAGWFLDEEQNRVVFVSKQVLVNRFHRDAPKVAESFDRFFAREIEELSAELGVLMSATLPSLLHAAKSGDQLVWVCGQLIGNSLESIVAALELLRVGRRLQPGVLLRTAVEGAAMAAYLFHEPADLGRFLAGQINSASVVGQAKSVIPFLPEFWGYLSKEFAHLGRLYRNVQPTLGYESADDPGAKTNLLGIHCALMLVWMVAELVFFESFSAHRFWAQMDRGQYALEIRPEMRLRMQEIADRLSLDDA